jgi:D-amino-acid oxidase
MNDFHIGRRSMLKLGMMAIAGSAIPGTRRARAAMIAPSSPQSIRTTLPKVQVLPDRIIRTVAGLRPYRPSGFLVRADRHGGKTIIHNYGHGGCGVTLSWGTAHLAVDLALKAVTRKAAVLGCGAVGLATARLLQDHGFQVTIYAKDLPPYTTSNIAGGLWFPVTLVGPEGHTPAFAAQLEEASRLAHRYYQTLVSDRYGVKWMEMYYLGSSPYGLSWGPSLTPDLYRMKTLAAGEHPFQAPFVTSIYTMEIEPSIYLPAVMNDFCIRGGKIAARNFPNLASILRLPETLIVNCTGLGAKPLFNDDELVPIKGQLTVLVPQPEIDYGLVSTSNDLYMFPRRDGIVLGGTHEEGEWSLEPDPAEADRIFKGHQELFSQMR